MFFKELVRQNKEWPHYGNYFPEIRLNITSEEIRASNRKLKCIWTYEAAQDLKFIHGICDQVRKTISKKTIGKKKRKKA